MRVIAGKARHLILVTPGGMETRPTQDRIKETLFNILQPLLPGCVFLDVFAGSGQMGIEALSRGAAKAVFIDSGAESCKCIQDNLTKTKLAENGQLIKGDFNGALSSVRERSVDIVFADPPYEAGLYGPLLAALDRMSYVTEDTMIILETKYREDLSFAEYEGSPFVITRVKEYKTNQHVFLERR